MRTQKAFDFEALEKRQSALRDGLGRFKLNGRAVEFILLMARCGTVQEINGHRCYKLQMSKRSAAREMGCAESTVLRAVSELVEKRCLEFIDHEGKRWYYLSADRVNELPDRDEEPDTKGLFREEPAPKEQQTEAVDHTDAGPPRSTPGPGARVRVEGISIPRVNRVPCAPCAPAPVEPLAASGAPNSGTLRDLTDEDLRSWNARGIFSAWRDCVGQGWLADSDEDRTKFLAAAHHSATAKGIHYPAKVLYAAIKRRTFERIPQASWDWAARQVRRDSAPPSVHAERLAGDLVCP